MSKISIFDFFGELPETDDSEDDNENKSELERKYENISVDISEEQKDLFFWIVKNMNHDNYDEYEHLPDNPVDHFVALCRHCREDHAVYGNGEHHTNGFSHVLDRHTFVKFMEDRLGYGISSHKEKKKAPIFPDFDVVEKGWLNSHKEFQPTIIVRETDEDGVPKSTDRKSADQSFKTKIHMLPWIEEMLDAFKFSSEPFVPAE